MPLASAAAEDLPAVHVVGGQVGHRAAAVVVVVDPHRPATPGPSVGWQRQRAWMEVFSSADITLSFGPQRNTVPYPVVEVEYLLGLGRRSRDR